MEECRGVREDRGRRGRQLRRAPSPAWRPPRPAPPGPRCSAAPASSLFSSRASNPCHRAALRMASMSMLALEPLPHVSDRQVASPRSATPRGRVTYILLATS